MSALRVHCGTLAQPRFFLRELVKLLPMFLWLLIIGGTLLALSFFVSPSGLLASLGGLLFVIGLVWFCFGAFVAARREGTSVGRAAVHAIRGALRVTWEFMP